MADLKIDWCSFDAARFACENWHYSKCMPNCKAIKLGVWEDAVFIGAVVFGDGANKNAFTPYGLNQSQGCELVRVALNKHETPVTRIIKISLIFLRRKCPGVKLCISFADTEQGHHGGIYQGGGGSTLGRQSQPMNTSSMGKGCMARR
jgi:hypothetical protein